MREKLKKVGRAVLAALTTPDAVKAEKYLGVVVAVRVLQAVGASAGLVELVRHLGG